MHHCIKKGEKYTSSILNATPLHNYTCHINIHGKLLKRENQEKLIEKNIKYLLKKGYKFTELDKNFIYHHNLLQILKKLK